MSSAISFDISATSRKLLEKPDNLQTIKVGWQMGNCRLYIGNLPYSTTDEQLRQFFHSVDPNVKSAEVVVDRYSGRSKGFGFVEFETEEAAKTAMEKANGSELDGRSIKVSAAKPVVPRPPRGGFGRQRY